MGTCIKNNTKHRNHSLDFLKFIASFLIVCIHFKVFGQTGNLISVIARFAVPVFFMISGYYAYNDDENKLKYKVTKIIKYIYLPLFCRSS